MIFFSAIWLSISDCLGYCRTVYGRARLLRANPTCRIGRWSQVSQVDLGKYVVVFDESTIAKIEATCWWDKSEEWLRANAANFLNIEQFLKKCV